jgi:hypothetical protein
VTARQLTRGRREKVVRIIALEHVSVVSVGTPSRCPIQLDTDPLIAAHTDQIWVLIMICRSHTDTTINKATAQTPRWSYLSLTRTPSKPLTPFGGRRVSSAAARASMIRLVRRWSATA